MNYYQQLIITIEKHIEQQQYVLALNLINEELKMPYVPSDVLSQLEHLKKQCGQLPQVSTFSWPEIKKMLITAPLMDQLQVLEYIRTLNLASLKDELIALSTTLQNAYIRGLLLLILSEQRLYDDLIIPDQQVDYQRIAQEFMLEFETNPSFLSQLLALLAVQATAQLPHEIPYLFKWSIVKRGFLLSNDEKQWYDYKVRNKIDEKDLLPLEIID